MIERVVRNDEVVGLIPICSTSLRSAELRLGKPAKAAAPKPIGRRRASAI